MPSHQKSLIMRSTVDLAALVMHVNGGRKSQEERIQTFQKWVDRHGMAKTTKHSIEVKRQAQEKLRRTTDKNVSEPSAQWGAQTARRQKTNFSKVVAKTQ
jgi:NAD(P)H-nitrite reductase large subunit